MPEAISLSLSVVIPVFGSAELVEPCLKSVRESSVAPFEITLVDDGSRDPDGIAAVAERYGARLIRFAENRGPSAARNAGAWASSGEIVVFLDADVSASRDTLQRIADAFEQSRAQGEPIDALMGSYHTQSGGSGWVAGFRNLLHAHVHHRSLRNASTFWTGCGAVRRDRFQELGGFDESRLRLEDVEFGLRLSAAGGRIVLDPSIQVTHRKPFTVWSMLVTDTIERAMPWADLVWEHGLPRDLNFRWVDRLAGMAALLVPLLGFLAIRFGRGWGALSAAALVSMILMELPLFRFLAKVRGLLFALASVPLYLAHLLAAGAGFAIGMVRGEFRRQPGLAWATGIVVVLVAAMQIVGGAYQAEFDAHPDESAHFMTGLMVRDYLVQWPAGSPLEWAKQYYVHYPKVAFGHWPPLFHVLEAGWWLFTPPSRTSGMILIGLLGIGAAVGMYRLARGMVNTLAALVVTAVLLATPRFQQAAEQQMAEMITLLFGVLFLGALARFFRDHQMRALALAGVWCALCLMVKGTGVGLLLALGLALLIAARRGLLRARWLVAPVVLVGAGLTWYLLQDASLAQTVAWGGLWWQGAPILLSVPVLAGWGVVALAAIGILSLAIKREPLTIASAAMLLSIVLTSLYMGAMGEPRHWIMALPPLLLLALTAVRRLAELASPKLGIAAAALALAAALTFFPWRLYTQQAAGYRILAESIRQPGRMMVGATESWLEGSWIILASLREPRPSSVIARASKVLSRSGWGGGRVKMLVGTPAEVIAALDRFGIETVVLDERHPATREGEYGLLKTAVSESSAWRLCAQTTGLLAYCRLQPVTNWEPLQVKFNWRSMGPITEQ